MTWQLSGYVGVLLLSAVVALGLSALAWRQRDEVAGLPSALLLLGMGGWALATAVQFGYTGRAGQYRWLRIGIAIGAVIPVLWLVFTSTYTSRDRWLNRSTMGLLLLEPLAMGALVLTDPLHGLVWSSVEFASAPIPHLEVTLGPAYLVHVAFAYLLIGVGIYQLLVVFALTSSVYRRQTGLLLVGAIVPAAFNVSFTLGGVNRTGIDFTPVTFVVSGVVFAVALFRFDLLDLKPVARTKLIDAVGTGMVVVNDRDRVLHVDGTAERVIPRADVGVDLTALLDVDAVSALDGRTVVADSDEGPRHYDLTTQPIRDFRGLVVGRLVAFQDVTDRRRYEQRLEVANRLLRHNLRNETGKIIGWASFIQQDASESGIRDLGRRIENAAVDLGELGMRARDVERQLDAATEWDTANAAGVLEDVAEDVAAGWPAADISVEAPGATPVRVKSRNLLRVAFENVLENAVEHSGSERPSVEARVSRDAPTMSDGGTGPDDDGVVVTVSDRGPGIPDVERRTFEVGQETPLQHSQGLGLWLTKWIIEHSGGTLSFADNEPHGTVVRIELATPE